jgi:protoheme IX farnesyltransferase
MNVQASQTVYSAGLSRLGDYAALAKVRLSLLVLAATLAGFLLGARGPLDPVLLIHTLAGTALVAFSAAALNQVLERDRDGRMLRTANRPLPAGRMSADEALYFGVGLGVAGTLELLAGVNSLAAALAAATLLLYLFVYTPLKTVSPLCLPAGAVPGAIPPLIGYAAAAGTLTFEAGLLALTVYFWQHPHFLAIAWRYRDDYARGGFAMPCIADPDGRATGRAAVGKTLALWLVALLPAATGVAGAGYAVAALLLGGGFLGCALAMARRPSAASARRLFWASIVYLPTLFAALVLDHVSR